MLSQERLRKIFSNTIGYYCVCVFFSLTSFIIYVFYSQIAPTILEERAYGKFLFHFIFGNWLAINIYFNYIMAWLTSPGLSKNYQYLAIQYPVCKKCSYNKPPRTHHCNWCNLCILRYDHHCPWLNNCVGFYNHRYFFQFCSFMCIGCLYAGWFGFYEYQISQIDIPIFGHFDSFYMAPEILSAFGVVGFITYYIFIIAFAMGFLLIALNWHHGRMIGRGETSVEHLLNKSDNHQSYEEGSTPVQIPEINRIQNWKRFLGVRNKREFIRRILFPSTHKPRGNGVNLDDYGSNTNFIIQRKNSDHSKQNLPSASHEYRANIDGYFPNKYRSSLTSSPRESLSNTVGSYYKPRPSPADWKIMLN